MINFVLNSHHAYTLKKVSKLSEAPALRFKSYDSFLVDISHRSGCYIFGDLDRLSHYELELAGRVYVEMAKRKDFRVLNNPARVLQRFELLRQLYRAGLNGFNVHRAADCSSSMRFPVFLRRERGHGQPLSELLRSVGEAEEAIESALNLGVSLGNMMLVEYMAQPVTEGIYRKWAAFRIGSRIVPYSNVHDTQWLVKYGKKGAATPEMYREEIEMMRSGKSPHEEHLRKVFDLAQIDYGRVDYGLVDGQVQVYEINTNPTFGTPIVHPVKDRSESLQLAWEGAARAMGELDLTETGRLDVIPRRWYLYRTIQWLRRWWWVKTRFVP